MRASPPRRTVPVAGRGLGDWHFLARSPGEVNAISLRLFDPKARQWSIFWAASTKCTLDPPVVGGFEHGDGFFYGPDTFDGKPILARFIWRRGERPHWEQAFSDDGGATWETNWTCEFERADTRA